VKLFVKVRQLLVVLTDSLVSVLLVQQVVVTILVGQPVEQLRDLSEEALHHLLEILVILNKFSLIFFKY
jgi:predicted methyltransferase